MQNELEISSTPHTPQSQATIRYDTGLLKLHAEYDYLLTRYLSVAPGCLVAEVLFHYQQCVEKYLKAYLAFVYDISFGQLKNGHNLADLLTLCMQYDEFFQDAKLHASCQAIEPFAEVGRYPNHLMQSYGFEYPRSLYFLDEFITKMRSLFQPRQTGENIADGIQAVALHENSTLQFGNQSVIATQLMNTFRLNNNYAQQIEAQIPSQAIV